MVKAADDFAMIARRRDEIRQETAVASLEDDIQQALLEMLDCGDIEITYSQDFIASMATVIGDMIQLPEISEISIANIEYDKTARGVNITIEVTQKIPSVSLQATLTPDFVKSTESTLRDVSPIDFGKLHYKECPATRGENWCNCEFIQAFVTSEAPTENLRKLDNR